MYNHIGISNRSEEKSVDFPVGTKFGRNMGTAMKTKQKETLKDQVYQRVIEEICTGGLTPDNIFTEGQLIEQFGVSKAPVREALVQLCHEEILRSIPRCGYQVIQINTKNIHDLTELRLLLEVGSLSAVMEHMDEATLAVFRKMNEDRQKNAVDRDIWTAWHNNLNYHLQLNAVAQNSKVTAALERALSECTRAYAQGYPDQRKTASANKGKEHMHDRVIEALANHDLAAAQEALTNDIIGMEKLLLEMPNSPIT